MKIAIIGASGRQGSCLTNEALRRGHEVTAIVRNPARLKTTEGLAGVLHKDLFELTRSELLPFDVVIDAFGTWTPETLHLHDRSLALLCDLLSETPVRLLVVGGAGSLYVDVKHSLMLVDSPGFPEEYRELARVEEQAIHKLEQREDVVWTYLCPPAVFDPQVPATGKYRLGEDELLVDSRGESCISYADYARAMIDEAENARFLRKRFTVASAEGGREVPIGKYQLADKGALHL